MEKLNFNPENFGQEKITDFEIESVINQIENFKSGNPRMPTEEIGKTINKIDKIEDLERLKSYTDYSIKDHADDPTGSRWEPIQRVADMIGRRMNVLVAAKDLASKPELTVIESQEETREGEDQLAA